MKYQAVKINFEPKERERENVISRTDETEEEGGNGRFSNNRRGIVRRRCESYERRYISSAIKKNP